MSKGRGKIEPKDNPKPFQVGNKASEIWAEDIALQLGKELIEWLKEKDENGHDKGNIFFRDFLTIEKNINLDIIAYLSEKYLTFAELIKTAKEIQEIKLVKYGVADRLNATMTKFVLTNHHGYSDKKEIKVDSPNINILANDPLSE